MGLVPFAVPDVQRMHLRRLAPAWTIDAAAFRYGVGVAVLAGLYYGAAKVGYALEFAGPVAAIVWLPVGVGIAYLSLAGLRFWPGVLIGDLFANDYSTLPLGSGLGQTCGNLVEVLVVALLLRRIARNADGPALGAIPDLGRVLLAMALGTAISATIGSISLRLGGVVPVGSMLKVWRTWWLGDFAGALLVVPLALAWWRPLPRRWWRGRRLEAALVLGAVAGLSELALHSSRPLTYVVFPALVWAALRFGARGATVTVAVTAAFAVWGTTHFSGPFHVHSIDVSLLGTQLYIAVAAFSGLFVAAVVSERERFADRLAAGRVLLVEAADHERRRLEHNLHDGAQQRLTALVVRLRLAGELTETAPARAPELFEEAATELVVAIDELRELARGINPPVLAAQGLAEAMRGVAARSSVPIALVELPGPGLGPAVEAAAYYVFAEAVTNAQRYAQATVIEVRAGVVRRILRVEVVDDGVGGAEVGPGSGLEGLRERLAALGGDLVIESPPGRGTRVVATIPVAAELAAPVPGVRRVTPIG